MLQLYKFVNIGDVYDFPEDMTQEGISKAIGVQRKHLPRTLKKLVQGEQVIENTAHVVGIKQKRKVYQLTWKGKISAAKLKEQVESWTVTVKLLDGSKKVMKLTDIPAQAHMLGLEGELTMLDIARLVEDGELDCAHAKKRLESEKRAEIIKGMHDSSERKMMIYETIMEKAWLDGHLTVSERAIVDELKDMLGITAEVHKSIEDRILHKHAEINLNRLEIYRSILETAWADGVITPDENAILLKLREVLGITPEQHMFVESEVWKGKPHAKPAN